MLPYPGKKQYFMGTFTIFCRDGDHKEADNKSQSTVRNQPLLKGC